ncbi:MAG TPA: hypothetical protein PLS00_00120 [Niabella sp.]|nr:hypothetical protein [Niabella sp.]
MKTCLAPVREDKYPELHNRRQVEQSFFDSLNNLAKLYGFALPDVATQPFPLNIAHAYRDAKEKVQTKREDLQLIISHSPTCPATLTKLATYYTGLTLYYIPVGPVYDLLLKPDKQHLTDIILPVFSYLYTIAGIPWMDEEGSFLSYCYQVLQEWEQETAEDEQDKAYQDDIIKRYTALQKGSAAVYQQIIQPQHLIEWESRLGQFVPMTETQENLLTVVENFFALYCEYPHRNAFDEPVDDLYPKQEEDHVTPYHYLSFFWDCNDDTYDHLMEYVNSYLREYSIIEEPVACQSFNRPQAAISHDLDFEHRLFTGIEDLIAVLNTPL